jgi:hypothetical protein
MGGVPDMQNTTVYPLAKAEDPPANQWVNWTELDFNTVHANDVRFYEEVDDLIQEEPTEALDPERAGQLAAIGLVKGQRFAPDDRLRGIHDNHDRERFLTRLPAIPPGPVADMLLPVEFAKSCSPRSRGLRMPDQSIHPAANQDTWPAPAP